MSARSSLWRGAWKGERSPPVTSDQPRTGGPEAEPGPASAPASTRATRRPSAACRSASHQVAVGDHGGGARVGQHVAHLGRGQAGVHGDGDAAGAVRGRVRHEPAQGELGAQMDADTPAGLEAGLEEPARHGVGGAVPLGEGHGTDVDHGEGGLVAELLGHAAQVLVHQHGCRPPSGTCRTSKVDAGVRFVAAWPMPPPGVNPWGGHPMRTAGVAGPGARSEGTVP